MMEVLRTDLTAPRGHRTIIDGDVTLLDGFDFNINGRLDSVVNAPFTRTIDRVGGQLKIDLPAFVPQKKIVAPDSATHFSLLAVGIDADFNNRVFVADEKETDPLPWDANPTAAISLATAVTANSTHPLFLVLGIVFYMQENGTMYPLKDKAFNALAIVGVSKP